MNKKDKISCSDVSGLMEEIAKGGSDSKTLELLRKAMEPLFGHISHCPDCLAKAEQLGLTVESK